MNDTTELITTASFNLTLLDVIESTLDESGLTLMQTRLLIRSYRSFIKGTLETVEA